MHDPLDAGGGLNTPAPRYQIPQYLLIGVGEILTAITTYDLFYSQVGPSPCHCALCLHAPLPTLPFPARDGPVHLGALLKSLPVAKAGDGMTPVTPSQVPSTMRSVCQALNLLTVTLGSMVSSAVLSIMKSW
jgi:hypothetical protein